MREEFDFPIFLNADHTHSLAKALEAAKAGFDAIIFDVSAPPFEQNVRQTKEAVAALKAINPSILVEGEIGDSTIAKIILDWYVQPAAHGGFECLSPHTAAVSIQSAPRSIKARIAPIDSWHTARPGEFPISAAPLPMLQSRSE